MLAQRRTLVLNMYRAMSEALGPSHWWPGETPFEVAIGAILTQNTNWLNVEKAIANLKREGLLTPKRLHALGLEELAELIRPAGYFRVKAGRIMNFLSFLRQECGYDMAALARRDQDELRQDLLGVKGIGPETADSILLYALEVPSFVVDAYTYRLLSRHGLIPEDAGYDEMRELFMDSLPQDTALFNEYHALIVRVGKKWCKKATPLCQSCPLNPYLPEA